MDWISVDEHLPELDRPVWLCCSDGRIFIGARTQAEDGWLWSQCYCTVDFSYRVGEGWTLYGAHQDDDYQVTHWMPLPEPPQENFCGQDGN